MKQIIQNYRNGEIEVAKVVEQNRQLFYHAVGVTNNRQEKINV
jgi:hypothetical protein